jgi:hypothetical protein
VSSTRLGTTQLADALVPTASMPPGARSRSRQAGE